MPVTTAATSDVQQRAERERDEDADGHVALRAAGLLGVRRDGIEADEGEEHDRRPEHDARQAVGHERAARGVVDGHQPAIQPQQCPAMPHDSASAFFCLALDHGRACPPRPGGRRRCAADRPSGAARSRRLGCRRGLPARQAGRRSATLVAASRSLPGRIAVSCRRIDLLFQSRPESRRREYSALFVRRYVLDQSGNELLFLRQTPSGHGNLVQLARST